MRGQRLVSIRPHSGLVQIERLTTENALRQSRETTTANRVEHWGDIHRIRAHHLLPMRSPFEARGIKLPTIISIFTIAALAGTAIAFEPPPISQNSTATQRAEKCSV